MKDCLFCKIIEGSIPSKKIYEDDMVFAFLDIACDVEGHTLVVPKCHCENILDCSVEYLNAVMNAVQKISRHYVDDCGYKGVNIMINNGKVAQQEVMHMHIHILPRKENDGNDIALRPKQEMDLQKIQDKLKMC